jgi:hypothetical protein
MCHSSLPNNNYFITKFFLGQPSKSTKKVQQMQDMTERHYACKASLMFYCV